MVIITSMYNVLIWREKYPKPTFYFLQVKPFWQKYVMQVVLCITYVQIHSTQVQHMHGICTKCSSYSRHMTSLCGAFSGKTYVFDMFLHNVFICQPYVQSFKHMYRTYVWPSLHTYSYICLTFFLYICETYFEKHIGPRYFDICIQFWTYDGRFVYAKSKTYVLPFVPRYFYICTR